MANPLTAGTWQSVAQVTIAGAKIAPQGTAAASGLAQPTAGAAGSHELSLAFGTATGEADILCGADYDIAGGGTVTIDLFANGLPNVFGGTANFLHIKAFYVSVESGGDSAGVTIGGAGANPNILYFGNVNDTWTIKPNGAPFFGGEPVTGVVVDATHRNVQIVNAGVLAATVRVLLAGTSV